MGSMMALEVREYPSISTRSNGMAASERPSRMASPLRPPANPAASTGTSRVLRDLATLTPFPPASVMLSGALCLWPSVRLGTTSVLATAALRVTVSIMPLPVLYSKIPPTVYHTPAARARPRDYDELGSTTRPMVADTISMPCASSDLVRRVRETPGHRLLRRVGRRVVLPFFRQRRDRHGLAHATPTSPERGRQRPRVQGEERGRPPLRALGPRCLHTHL